jgi:gamma-glutamylcyclotransferase (GGCT)/AIG2-like uncharacterized protein YtfP
VPLYFAYGSNMDVAAMAARCPGARLCGPAELSGYRFYIMREGYASIARDPKTAVFGLLWQVANADMAALDMYEEVASGLYGKRMAPVLLRGGHRQALVYWGRSAVPGVARPNYMEAVLSAAEKAALPIAYRRFLESFLPAGRSAVRPFARSSGLPFTAHRTSKR